MASRPFRAGFDSDCAACGGGIFEGDEICMDDGEAVHVDCVDD